ncbi:hypothetical protein LguiA_021484 [Lonicera macranthoides]
MFTDGVRILNEQIDQFISTFGSIGKSSIGKSSIGKSSIGKSNPIVGDSIVHGFCNIENNYNEPDLVRAKGCGKRLKGGKEKALTRAKNKKVRRCHGCDKVGQAHDKRNCPALTNQRSPFEENENLEKGNESSTEDDDDDISLP